MLASFAKQRLLLFDGMLSFVGPRKAALMALIMSWRNATMEPQINPVHEVRRRTALRLCAAAALGLALLLTEQATVFAQTAQTDEPLGFIKFDRIVIQGQIDLSVSYLTLALSMLESSESPADIEAASARAYAAYRLMRFAESGLAGLGQKHGRVPNPLFRIVSETLDNSRGLIRFALLLLEGAAKWPERDESQSQRMEAISKLKDALLLAQQARMLT